jgi:flap endonuclease-1
MEKVSLLTFYQFIELCILLGCDYLEPCKGIGPKTALKLLREHNGLAGVVEYVRGKMAEKASDNAAVIAQSDEEEDEEEIHELPSDRESEEGDGSASAGGGEPSSPVKTKKKVGAGVGKSPAKKKKISSAGMQIPDYWPWEEAKKLFITPDVVKGDDLEVSRLCKWLLWFDDLSSSIGKLQIRMDW